MESKMKVSDTPKPGALDRAGAARYLSISTRLLDDLLSAGTIRRIKLGRKTLVRVCDLDRYLAELAGEVVK
jgi:excisionase family DNA binding protein